jgi:hypothetical protein
MDNRLPPKPVGALFGLIIDGQRKTIGFPGIKEAERAAPPGRDVAIFDMVTGQIVKRL